MKVILVLAATLLVSSAYAQMDSSPMGSASGTRHMFEFNADSVLQGVFSLDKSKTPNSAADNDTELDLGLNYAYQLDTMPMLQLAGRFNYLKDTNSGGDVENWGLQAGGIYNHGADLRNSFYGSLYLGLLWNREYGSENRGGNYNDEILISTLALGKRYSMEEWGIKHLTYSPEVALQNRNSTNGGDFEYTQSLELRFLQFSVFF